MDICPCAVSFDFAIIIISHYQGNERRSIAFFLSRSGWDTPARGRCYRKATERYAQPQRRSDTSNLTMNSNSRLVVYIDVDGTCPLCRDQNHAVSSMVEHTRGLASEGAELYCWSTARAEYARSTAQRLGIEHCFTGFLPKPHIVIEEDQTLELPHGEARELRPHVIFIFVGTSEVIDQKFGLHLVVLGFRCQAIRQIVRKRPSPSLGR